MLSINTNLSSLIAQNSMSSATKLLNQAVERMTTGYKINHAKDNAANYSISTNLTTKINAYMVAEDNCAMGLDMLATANGSLDQISDKLTRLRDLQTQASNGTYGATSLNAINAEANALVDEISRLYQTAEYNGKKLFIPNEYPISSDIGPQPVAVMAYNLPTEITYTETEVQAMTKVAEVSTFSSGQKYSISSVEELQKLADYVNSGNDTTGVEFVLGADIDLSSISNWTPIGDYSTSSSYQFKGTFDGNGHVIKNLTINNPTKRYQGLFGYASKATLKNVNMYNVNIIASRYAGSLSGYLAGGGSVEKINVENFNITTSTGYTGGIIASLSSASSLALNISECSASGTITSNGKYNGGIFGYASGYSSSNKNLTVNACNVDVEITGTDKCGGIGGLFKYGYASNCNVSGTVIVTDTSSSAGGLFAEGDRVEISNSNFKGNVSGSYQVGGGVGNAYGLLFTNCYIEGNIQGEYYTGGLIGYANNTNILYSGGITNVFGEEQTGGFCGHMQRGGSITNSYIKGKVLGTEYVGGGVGRIMVSSDYGTTSLDNNIILANVKGDTKVGSIIGECILNSRSTTIENLSMKNCQVLKSDNPNISSFYDNYSGAIMPSESELNTALSSVVAVELPSNETLLQIGITTNSNCQLALEVSFEFTDILHKLTDVAIKEPEYFNIIDNALNIINAKQTEFGAVENRLNSALDEISIQYENLVSSRSTIRDADIAEVSSEYIRQQILQQASATLLSTANQSPSIALQLI